MFRGNFVEALLIIGIIFFLGLFLFYRADTDTDTDKNEIKKCVQSLGTWRKLMFMYENDSEYFGKSEPSFPTELNWRPGMDNDVHLINAFSPYTDVTKNLKECAVTLFTSVTTRGFTISAWAKDSKHTLITATPDAIMGAK